MSEVIRMTAIVDFAVGRWRYYVKSPYYRNYFPYLRALLWRRGFYLLQWCGESSPRLLVAARHPRGSITWTWQLTWWPSWCVWRGWRWSTQDYMPWRKGAFARMDESTLQ